MILSLQSLSQYTAEIFDDLGFKIWYGDGSMSFEIVVNIANGRKISLFDQIIEILEYLKALCSHHHLDISEEVNVCIQKLKNLVDKVNLNIRSKLQFIVKQFQLAFYENRGDLCLSPITFSFESGCL